MGFEELLRDYCHGDEAARTAAESELRGLARSGALDAAQVRAMLAASAGPMNPGKYEWMDPACTLVWFVRDAIRVNPEAACTLADALEAFARASQSVRAAILQLFTTCPTVESALAYVAAVTGSVTGGGDPFAGAGSGVITTFRAKQSHPAGAGAATPEMASVLFPDVLPAAEWETSRQAIYLMLLEFLDAGLIEIDAIGSHQDRFIELLRESMDRAIALQQENRPGHFNWKYEGAYASVQELAGLLMDIAGRWKASPVLDVMREDRAFIDPRLRMFHATSRMRLGLPVSQAELADIAESPRECYLLRMLLDEAGLSTHLPPACRDQKRIAEGLMVDWLCFGTELGREPDEIELVHVETRRTGRLLKLGPRLDYYFFKYRVTEEGHSAQEDGWMVGMAGGFRRVNGGTMNESGATFSKFEAWDEKPLEEHVKDYL